MQNILSKRKPKATTRTQLENFLSSGEARLTWVYIIGENHHSSDDPSPQIQSKRFLSSSLSSLLLLSAYIQHSLQ